MKGITFNVSSTRRELSRQTEMLFETILYGKSSFDHSLMTFSFNMHTYNKYKHQHKSRIHISITNQTKHDDISL